MSESHHQQALDECSVAVIGMAGKFPGADNIEQYWRLLESGSEGIRAFDNDSLEAIPKGLDINDPRHVKSQGVISDIAYFDAPFFNIPPQEAKWLDPQQRLFLEHCWLALENAGYDPSTYREEISVYGGTNLNSYLLTRLEALTGDNTPDLFQIMMSNDKDFLTTRVGYKLGLRGECLSIQTSCSTSLVSIHMACQSLLSGQSSMALAGGASVRIPHHVGYVYQKGMISSPDGHCRPFDVHAKGTVPGSGVGVVLLKRLEDAINDRDNIYAVIRSSAINNDGLDKVGFTAPSVSGQADVIKKALLMADISADSIGFVEAHGTATPLGDPIEVEALSRAFRDTTNDLNYCALGSVKSNIGHLDAAAGVAGFIKSVLAVYHGKIPPTVHFTKPNPKLKLESSPFFVNNRTVEWPRLTKTLTRRAGISSFGIGGTNAHVIIEQYVNDPQPEPEFQPRYFPVSAATLGATFNKLKNLARHVREHRDINLANLSFTLTNGRKAFPYRTCVVSSTQSELVEKLDNITEQQIIRSQNMTAAFVFCGQGISHVTGLAKALFSESAIFRQLLETCHQTLYANYSLDLLAMLLGDKETRHQPGTLLPTLFSLQYALAKTLIHEGINPQYLMGHSFGEYAAACIAGVFELDDGLKIARERGVLVETLAPGAMLSISVPVDQITPLLSKELSLAIHNGPDSCVVSGPVNDIEELLELCKKNQFTCKRLPVSHAFHSKAIDQIADKFNHFMATIPLKQPQIPVVSNLTGNMLTDSEAQSAEYWVKQMRNQVLFYTGTQSLISKNVNTFIEIGPSNSLIPLLRYLNGPDKKVHLTHGLPRQTQQAQGNYLRNLKADLWSKGLPIDWTQSLAEESVKRISLPPYPFEKQRFWVEQSYAIESSPSSDESFAAEQKREIRQTNSESDVYHHHQLDRDNLNHVYEAPKNELERIVINAWQHVLGVDGIGRLDNFFDLGGDSLLSVQVHNRLKDQVSTSLEIEELMFLESPQAIAEFIQNSQQNNVKSKQSGIPVLLPEQRKQALPLSFSQEGLWSAEHAKPGSAYNLPFAIRIKGNFNQQIFATTLKALVSRHEILRARFPEQDGYPKQKLIDDKNPQLNTHDLRSIAQAQKEEALSEHIDHQARQPFNLKTGPLFRIDLYRLQEDEFAALFTLHHIVADAWSMRIFARELSEIYTALETQRDPRLPELPIQYFDYAHWQRQSISEQTIQQQRSYWMKQLANLPEQFEIGQDYPAPESPSGKGSRVNFEFPTQLTPDLITLARASNVSLFTVLIAGLSALLHRRSGLEDMIVGVPIAGRNNTEIENVIGCFINTLVIRSEFKRNLSFGQLVQQIRQTMSEAYKHQDLPFEKVVKACQQNKGSRAALTMPVMFDFQNIPDAPPLAIGNLDVEPMVAKLETAKMDLVIDMWNRDGALAGSVEYNTEIYQKATVEKLMQEFSTLLATVASTPDFKVSSRLLSPKEQRLQRNIELQKKQKSFQSIRPASISIDE